MSESVQAYNGRCIESLLALGDRIFDSYFPAPILRPCQFETTESVYGACDGQICLQPGTVFSLASDLELCTRHFNGETR
jgi:hypothetical protein